MSRHLLVTAALTFVALLASAQGPAGEPSENSLADSKGPTKASTPPQRPPATSNETLRASLNSTKSTASNSGKIQRKAPPYPQKGTDTETATKERLEYIQWIHENEATQEFIVVKLKPGLESRPRALISPEMALEIGRPIDMALKPHGLLGLPDWQILKMPRKMTEKMVVENLCDRVKQNPDILECSGGGAVYPFGVPTDPGYKNQWGFKNGPGAANIEKAWETTTGSATTIVAILDSGITTHEDLANSRILPGYDFISDPLIANDGNGRDANPSDPGDWITTAERDGNGPFRNCEVGDSSWHGTHITGIIGATANNTNNNKGVAGINWATKLLPVRTMGKCGNRSVGAIDVSDAILWAAGAAVGTLPVNPNIAKVINMSLTGSGTCPPFVQAAIDEATKRGSVVIAAAGNNRVSGSFWPATCKNVLSVVATDTTGKRAEFSNFGGGVGVSAPGTDILSTVNPGKTVPLSSSDYDTQSGTSQAAAFVSGIASLMLAVNSKLTPIEIREIIKASAKPFAQGSTVILGECGSGSCGTGIVNAAEAIKLAKMGQITYGNDDVLYSNNLDNRVFNNGYNGDAYLAGVLPNGKVVGWGANFHGQLGTTSVGAVVKRPTIVAGLENVERIFTAHATMYAIQNNGEAYALGRGTYCNNNYPCTNQNNVMSYFGDIKTIPESSTPIRTPIFDNAIQIIATHAGDFGNSDYSNEPIIFAITASGQLMAWGYNGSGNDEGLLGLGPIPTIPMFVTTPMPITGLPPIRKITTHLGTTLALDINGNVWGWGIVGDGNSCDIYANTAPVIRSYYSPTPHQIPGLSSVIDLEADLAGGFAVTQDGFAWAIGCSGTSGSPLPAKLATDSVVSILVSQGYTYLIRNDGSVWDTRNLDREPILQNGGIRFIKAEGVPFISPLVQMADGHAYNLDFRSVSNTESKFGQDTLCWNGACSGRLNIANLTFDDDSDLQVLIASDIANASPGQAYSYSVTVKNNGSGPANDAYVTVAIPTTVKINSVPSGCSQSGQVVYCNLGSFASGQSTSITISVTALTPTIATATAYVSSNSYDYAASNNTAGSDVSISAASEGDVPTLPEWGAMVLGTLLLLIGSTKQIVRRERILSRA